MARIYHGISDEAKRFPIMTNYEVIQAFIAGKPARSHNGNLRTDGTQLVNYSTVLALKQGDTVFYNSRKYSPTTSTIQNILWGALYAHFNVIEVDGQPCYATI